MEVKNLTLHNIGRFKHLEIPLAPLGYLDSNVTVFVGKQRFRQNLNSQSISNVSKLACFTYSI
ncbi:hypothetical protein L360_04744 [Enterobacter sp. MGH 14]|nr:hypothetical protein L360_04744 [Enterobacter sp. MGH 14]